MNYAEAETKIRGFAVADPSWDIYEQGPLEDETINAALAVAHMAINVYGCDVDYIKGTADKSVLIVAHTKNGTKLTIDISDQDYIGVSKRRIKLDHRRPEYFDAPLGLHEQWKSIFTDYEH